MVYQLQRSQQLYCSLETAWKFFSSPHNLSRITPKEMKFRVMTGLPNENISEGMIIDYEVSPLLGIPLHWRTKITNVNPQKSFTDIQLKGPYKVWNHLHEFVPNEKGVLMKDTVNYELPMSLLGSIAHSFIVRKKLMGIFDFRQTVCESLFNSQREGV